MPLLKTNSFLFIFLAIATFACQIWIDRYQQAGPELLTGNWITNASGGNRVNITNNELTLLATNPRTGAGAYQYLSVIEHGAVLMFSAEIKCDNVVRGGKPWNLARLNLIQNDGTEDRWDLMHVVAMLTGTHNWQSYQNFFYITPQTQSIRIAAEIHRTTGALQIRNMQLYPVEETATYLWSRKIILVSWGLFFLLLVGSCFIAEKKSMLFRILLVGAFISIVVGTSLPGYMKTVAMYAVEAQIDEISPVLLDIVPWDLTKIWHASIFFLLGITLSLILRKAPFSHVITVILMLAGGTEMIQLYIDGRTPLISDFFIDAAGGIAGSLLVRLFSVDKNTDYRKSDS